MSDVLNMQMVQELRDIMEDEFPSLLETFLDESQRQYREVNEAWAAKDMDSLRRCAHTLKGSCANIGAEQLQASCQNLESLAHTNVADPIPELLETVASQLRDVDEALRAL